MAYSIFKRTKNKNWNDAPGYFVYLYYIQYTYIILYISYILISSIHNLNICCKNDFDTV